MLNLVVGSLNPVKINAVEKAFAQVFAGQTICCRGVDAPSGIADQPLSSQETRTGAINRVQFCQQHHQADFYVAIEGGVDNFIHGPATFAFIAISDGQGLSIGRSANLPLPKGVFNALAQGEELGDVMDRLFSEHNVKQKQGAIGLLTQGHATRESIYTQAIILALSPMLNKDLYNQEQ